MAEKSNESVRTYQLGNKRIVIFPSSGKSHYNFRLFFGETDEVEKHWPHVPGQDIQEAIKYFLGLPNIGEYGEILIKGKEIF